MKNLQKIELEGDGSELPYRNLSEQNRTLLNGTIEEGWRGLPPWSGQRLMVLPGSASAVNLSICRRMLAG
jgi:hypothetical protein